MMERRVRDWSSRIRKPAVEEEEEGGWEEERVLWRTERARGVGR